MAVGRLRRFVVDVNDLAVGERLWSAVTGLPVEFSGCTSSVQGQFSGLGAIETALKNRAHLDIGVDDVPGEVAEVIALGGNVLRPPGVFPEHDPELEWAVVADPFGNEFCLVRDIEES
jgi:predicted enzyme related to lactoylglutathione lyase